MIIGDKQTIELALPLQWNYLNLYFVSLNTYLTVIFGLIMDPVLRIVFWEGLYSS